MLNNSSVSSRGYITPSSKQARLEQSLISIGRDNSPHERVTAIEKEYPIQTVQELDKQLEEKEADQLIRNLVKTQSSIRTQLFHQKDGRIRFSVHRRPKRMSIVLTELREVIAKYQTDTPDATCTFPRNPKLLVKKPIKHKLRNDNGEELWYDGTVKTYRRSNFEIQYTGEECTYLHWLSLKKTIFPVNLLLLYDMPHKFFRYIGTYQHQSTIYSTYSVQKLRWQIFVIHNQDCLYHRQQSDTLSLFWHKNH